MGLGKEEAVAREQTFVITKRAPPTQGLGEILGRGDRGGVGSLERE